MRALVSLAFLALVACGGNDDAKSSSVTSGSTVSTQCAADNRKDVYAPGMTKPAGPLTVKLVSATPGPPELDNNAMSFVVTDAAGAPVDGATITVVPTMPDHGHGSAIKPSVAAKGGGAYDVTNLYLAMAGLWRIAISIQRGPGDVQEADFQFCLDG